MSELRHTRQARLAEVGADGQARLVGSEAVVPSHGFAADIEARYLAAAGVHVVRGSDDGARAANEPSEQGAPFGIADESASELARGAHAALARIRVILAVGQS